MKKFIAGTICGMLILVGTGQLRADWNVASDFRVDNSNPNGVWSYGTISGSAFTPYSYAETAPNATYPLDHWRAWMNTSPVVSNPLVWMNDDTVGHDGVLPGQLSLHPGYPGGEASLVRWTAPPGFNSLVRVHGQFLPGDAGGPDLGIFVNHTPTASPDWSGHNFGTFDFTSSVPLVTGDTIDFAVYNSPFAANTPLDATISPVPEPSTLIFLGSGAIGLIRCLWRRKRAAQLLTNQSAK